MICLDTNAVISLLNDKRSPLLSRIVTAAKNRNSVGISSIVLFELWYGVGKSIRRRENAERLHEFMSDIITVLNFDKNDAQEAGDIRAALKDAGTPIGPYDVLIAAQARRRDAVLISANIREFARVPGLKLEDWTRTDQ